MNVLSPPVRTLALSVFLQFLSCLLIFAFGLLPSTWWMLYILMLSVPSALRLREALLGRPSSVSPSMLLFSLFALAAVLVRLAQVY